MIIQQIYTMCNEQIRMFSINYCLLIRIILRRCLKLFIISFSESIPDPLHQLLWNMPLIIVSHSFYAMKHSVLFLLSSCILLHTDHSSLISPLLRPSPGLATIILLSTCMRPAFLASTCENKLRLCLCAWLISQDYCPPGSSVLPEMQDFVLFMAG